MKRRTFLATSSTVGIASVVPSGFVATSIFSSLNTKVLLEEFQKPTKVVLDKFMADVSLNIQSLGLDETLAKRLVLPVEIINNKSTKGNHNIIYKNGSGEYISLSITNGIERIKISKTV